MNDARSAFEAVDRFNCDATIGVIGVACCTVAMGSEDAMGVSGCAGIGFSWFSLLSLIVMTGEDIDSLAMLFANPEIRLLRFPEK